MANNKEIVTAAKNITTDIINRFQKQLNGKINTKNTGVNKNQAYWRIMNMRCDGCIALHVNPHSKVFGCALSQLETLANRQVAGEIDTTCTKRIDINSPELANYDTSVIKDSNGTLKIASVADIVRSRL